MYSGKRVLVVEMDSTTHYALEQSWFVKGYGVRIVGSASIALNFLKTERFDAVVIGTPFGMTGPELFAAIESGGWLVGVPVILCTNTGPS